MRTLHRVCFLVGAVALALGALVPSAYGQAHFKAALTGAQENPPLAVPGRGTAAFTLTDAGLQYFVTVEGLTGPITAAHIHSGPRGVNGGVVHNIGSAFHNGSNTARGIWTGLTTAQIASLMNGDYYVNVHTAANPGGEIRGQIDVSGGAHLSADMTTEQENPPVVGNALGTGAFTVTEEGLKYRITVNGLTGGITGAHIHRGATGVNGPVIFDLGPSFAGTTAEGVWETGPAAPAMTKADIVDLLTGELYVNVHTAANPGGEVRGQIELTSGFGFSTALDEAQEVPPSGAPGEGAGSFTLTPNGLVFDLTVEGLTGPITAAHFHRGAVGVNGPPVRTITGDFVGLKATGVWRADDGEPLTADLICALLEGDIYVNVHTAANSGGEIRGQVTLNAGLTTLAASLTDDQEVPPTGVAGAGTGTFRLGPGGLEFDITVDNLTGPITAAHIHEAPTGVNGGVIFNLGPFFAGNTAHGNWAGITVAQRKQLLRGNYYVNVHTGANPGGEIRGQIVVSSGCGFEFDLTGDQEVPAVATGGLGTGAGTLTNEGYLFAITADGLSGPVTAAHFHAGATGVGGGVVRDFSGAVAMAHVEDVWHPTDAQPLTPARVDEIFLGGIYANLHTAANPGGEIRGQSILSEGFFSTGLLSGGSEVPPVSTNGKGTASVVMCERGVVFDVSFNDTNGPFTMAHFHSAPVGVNGPVVFDITGTFAANTGRGTWRTDAASAFDVVDACDYLFDELYINVHTTAHSGGEVRSNPTELTPSSAPDRPEIGNGLTVGAWPNPLASSGEIRFAAPRDGEVEIALFDVSGKRVRDVFAGEIEAGEHTVAVDRSGLSGGVYFVRMRQDDAVASSSVIVIR